MFTLQGRTLLNPRRIVVALLAALVLALGAMAAGDRAADPSPVGKASSDQTAQIQLSFSIMGRSWS